MRISKKALKETISKNLASGVRPAQATKALRSAGIKLKYKGKVPPSELRKAYAVLKDKGMLSAGAKTGGRFAFERHVKEQMKDKGDVGLSEARKSAHAKALLRERQVEEERKEKRISTALSGGEEKGKKLKTKKSSSKPQQMHVGGGVVAGQAQRKSAPKKVISSVGSETRPKKKDSGVVGIPKRTKREEEPPDMFGPDV